jgi:pSer/pThr/pTyr-binding forkhead associated (FHA) protein
VLPRPSEAKPVDEARPSQDVSRTAVGSADAQDATVVVPSSPATQAARLERIAPKDKREAMDLRQDGYVFGRSRSSGIPLYTATASREHARLVRQGGRWAIEPLAHKVVVAGGVRVTRGTVQLTHKMRLKMGEDEFLFLDESAPPSEAEVGRTWWTRVLAWLSRWAPKAGG